METPSEQSPIKPTPTRLIIEQASSLKALNTSPIFGRRFNVKDITLGRSRLEGSFSYYRLSNLSKTESVEVLMRTGSEIKKIDLPQIMLERIASFLKRGQKKDEKFDGGSFVHYVSNIPYNLGAFHSKDWDVSRFVNISKFTEEQLKAGDIIMISKDDYHQQITYYGIYLGEGLYLSKFGNKGKLIVANLKEMRKSFGGKNVFQIKPKQNLPEIQRGQNRNIR